MAVFFQLEIYTWRKRVGSTARHVSVLLDLPSGGVVWTRELTLTLPGFFLLGSRSASITHCRRLSVVKGLSLTLLDRHGCFKHLFVALDAPSLPTEPL